MYNNKAITSNDAVRNKFQLELANRFENLQINEDDTVQTAYLRGRKDWERKKYAKLKNANQLIVFGNAELKTAIHRFFVKCENKNCEVLSKNWKNLHFTMLILACTNYISWYESNFQYEKWDHYCFRYKIIFKKENKVFGKKFSEHTFKKKKKKLKQKSKTTLRDENLTEWCNSTSLNLNNSFLERVFLEPAI